MSSVNYTETTFLTMSVGWSLIDDHDDEDDDDDDGDVADVEAERDAGEDEDRGTEIMTAVATTIMMTTMVRHRRWRRQL